MITCDGTPLSNTHCHQSQAHTHPHIFIYINTRLHAHTNPKKYARPSVFSLFSFSIRLFSQRFPLFVNAHHPLFYHSWPFGHFTVSISPTLSFARSLSHQFHIFSAPSFSFPLRFSFFLCEVAVGGMAGRRGSPEGILGAEVPVIHYPACFSLWQACDRVLLRHTHRHTRSCI